MKKISMLLLSCCLLLLNTISVSALQDNFVKIAEIEAKLKELESELYILKGGKNTLIASDDKFVIEFVGVEEMKDEGDGTTYYEYYFNVENKTDQELEIQSRGFTLNGETFDDDYFIMSDTLAPKSVTPCNLTYRLFLESVPKISGTLEFEFVIFNPSDFNSSNTNSRFPYQVSLFLP